MLGKKSKTSSSTIDRLVHIYCCICYPDIKKAKPRCGSKTLGIARKDSEVNCVVCLDLKNTPCRRHG